MGERLTKRVIDATQPTGRDAFLFDSDIKGFALKITAGGKKVFTYQGRVAGEKIRVTIGPYGAFTCDQARAEAEKLRAMFARGIRPSDLEKAAEADATQQRREAEEREHRAFSAVAGRYIGARVRKQTKAKPVEALIRNVFVGRWQDRDIANIARRDVVAVIDEMVADGRPGAAREALKRTRLDDFSWGEEFQAICRLQHIDGKVHVLEMELVPDDVAEKVMRDIRDI